jgi:hypothetical protein
MQRGGERVDAKRLVQVAHQQPHWPQQLEAEANEEVQCDAAHPHEEELQVDQVVGAEESAQMGTFGFRNSGMRVGFGSHFGKISQGN